MSEKLSVEKKKQKKNINIESHARDCIIKPLTMTQDVFIYVVGYLKKCLCLKISRN